VDWTASEYGGAMDITIDTFVMHSTLSLNCWSEQRTRDVETQFKFSLDFRSTSSVDMDEGSDADDDDAFTDIGYRHNDLMEIDLMMIGHGDDDK
jgi:hypothetical protein